MNRIAILNMLIGFSAIFLAACAGSFIAFDTTEAFIKDKALLESWQMIMLKSAHGHTNLFGMIHIALGLTMPWSKLSLKIKKLQTIGLSMGTFAMSALMTTKSYMGPANELDFLDISIGIFLSAALLSIGLQCYGLYGKLAR